MSKTTSANNAPKNAAESRASKPIWLIAKASNEKGVTVKRRFNPNCRRVGLL